MAKRRTVKRKTKPNPTDATMRNIHAHRRRLAGLEKRVMALESKVSALYVEATRLEAERAAHVDADLVSAGREFSK